MSKRSTAYRLGRLLALGGIVVLVVVAVVWLVVRSLDAPYSPPSQSPLLSPLATPTVAPVGGPPLAGWSMLGAALLWVALGVLVALGIILLLSRFRSSA